MDRGRDRTAGAAVRAALAPVVEVGVGWVPVVRVADAGARAVVEGTEGLEAGEAGVRVELASLAATLLSVTMGSWSGAHLQ